MKRQSVGKKVDGPKVYSGRQWGDPFVGEKTFRVERTGQELKVIACYPAYAAAYHACDFSRLYEYARRSGAASKQRSGKNSPHIAFANAETDEDLVKFVRKFGPVVASRCKAHLLPARGTEVPLCQLIASQVVQELRHERDIYRAALALVVEIGKPDKDFNIEVAQKRIQEVSKGVEAWPDQWDREHKHRGDEPLWKLKSASAQRIAQFASSSPDAILNPKIDGRIVLCELVNVFPGLAFPNPIEMHSYISFGIRPLLYSALRTEFLNARNVHICANDHCRRFFEIDRAGKRHCTDICSRQHRQREYWENKGKYKRQERTNHS